MSVIVSGSRVETKPKEKPVQKDETPKKPRKTAEKDK